MGAGEDRGGSRASKLSDAELINVAVVQALVGYASRGPFPPLRACSSETQVRVLWPDLDGLQHASTAHQHHDVPCHGILGPVQARSWPDHLWLLDSTRNGVWPQYARPQTAF